MADNYEPNHDVRDFVLAEFRRLGGDRDRWESRDIYYMCASVTRCEDIIELRTQCKNRDRARLTLKKIRRQLELESD